MCPKISIVIPVYNSAEYLEKCLGSIMLAIRDFDAEVIIVYDESTDSSFRTCSKYLDGSKVRLIAGSARGCGAARNAGIVAANGTFITFVDADDSLAPGFHYSDLKLEDGDWDFLNFRFRFRDANGNAIKTSRKYRTEYILGNDIFLNACVSGEIYTVVWNKVYRSEFLRNKRVFFPEVKEWEDIVFTHRVAYCATKAKFSNIFVYDALRRDDSRSRVLTTEFILNAIETLRLDEGHFSKCEDFKKIGPYLASYYIRHLMFFSIKAMQKAGSNTDMVLAITSSEFFSLKAFFFSMRYLRMRDCLLYCILKLSSLRRFLGPLIWLVRIRLY